MRSRKMEWRGHVACMPEMENTYNTLIRKPGIRSCSLMYAQINAWKKKGLLYNFHVQKIKHLSYAGLSLTILELKIKLSWGVSYR